MGHRRQARELAINQMCNNIDSEYMPNVNITIKTNENQYDSQESKKVKKAMIMNANKVKMNQFLSQYITKKCKLHTPVWPCLTVFCIALQSKYITAMSYSRS